MRNQRAFILAALVSLLVSVSAKAAEIVRDAALIESMPVQGATLSMSDEDVFNHFTAMGYSAHGVATFADWTTSGINMVRGDFSAPEGRSEISISRTRAGRLVNLSETFNRPKQKFDAAAEVQAMRDHFGIAADNPKCKANEHGSGSCRVGDAEENANNAYGLSIMSGAMVIRYATRNHELKDGMW